MRWNMPKMQECKAFLKATFGCRGEVVGFFHKPKNGNFIWVKHEGVIFPNNMGENKHIYTCVFLSMLNFCSFGKKCFFWITTIFLVSERFLGFIKFINPFHISVVLERRSGSQNILLVIVGFFQDVVQNQNHSWQSAIIANTSNRRLVLHQTKHQITSCCSSEQDYQDLHRFCIH